MSNQLRTLFRNKTRAIAQLLKLASRWSVSIVAAQIFLVALGASSASINGQTPSSTLQVNLVVIATSPARVRIEVESAIATDVWSFPNVYGSVIGLGERFENLTGVSASGMIVPSRRVAPGEFKTAETVKQASYEVSLAEPDRVANKSHISWLNSIEGLLMMADLLPSGTAGVSVNLRAPDGWEVSSIAQKEGESFVSSNASKMVFLVGTQLKEKATEIDSNDWLLSSVEGWIVSENDIKQAIGKIAKEYRRVTGFRIKQPVALYLVPLRAAGADRWTAETRGNTIVLVMGQRGGRRELLARLKVILTHELFHLWVPNALALSGDYDWFFEGFTLYQALRTTQKLGLVGFGEYLRTMARVYDSYLLAADRDQLSLLELSERRWTSSNSLVYDRGMLVAFLYDLQLRLLSGGKQSVSDVYPQLFANPQRTSSPQANDVIIGELERPEGMGQFSSRYIRTNEALDLQKRLSPYGIEVSRENFKTQLKVASNLSEVQRRLLKSLGYKN